MKPSEAARIIGCSVYQVRALCRKGIIPSAKVPIDGGYRYEITEKAAKEYAKTPQAGGWKRGQPRS